MSIYAPTSNYRTVLRFGYWGWDVWVTQMALGGLALDGQYGAKTEAVVKAIQRNLGVTPDGVLGPITQDALCKRESHSVEAGITPPGLLIGICRGESGAIIAATTTQYPDGSRDFFAFQENMTAPSLEQLRVAANVRSAASKAARRVSAAYGELRLFSGSLSDQTIWKLAVLAYNWPAAARRLAKGERQTWQYWEPDGKGPYHLDDPAPWVELYKIPGITTGWDWCQHYIDSKIGSVTSWTV